MRSLHQRLSLLLALAVCSTASHAAESGSVSAPGERKGSGLQVRLVFLSTLTEQEELVLASPAKEGNWKEHGELKARPSFITQWLEAAAGEMHLTRRMPEGLVSLGRMDIPAGARSTLVVVAADPEGKRYRCMVIDPAKNGFTRGSCLLMNFSKKRALLGLGERQVIVEAGATKVSRIIPEANGMYRMQVGYKDEEDEMVVCYDRYVSSNPKAREFLFLLSDRNLGLRVLSLPEFGEMD